MTGRSAILRADARCLPLADSTVDLIVTSPPYFGLRSYQDGGEHYAGQIGDEPTPAEFVDALLDVTRECVRVLKPSGSLWVNLGDKYSGAQQQNSGRQSVEASSSYWRRTDPKRTGIPNKSLMGIPWRYALRCIDDLGLILRAEVVWSKPNGLPESVTDRVRRSHEQWFHFTVSPRYFSAVDEVREAQKLGQSAAALSFNRLGRETAPGQSMAPHRVGRNDQGLHPLGKLPGSVWTIPTAPLNVPAQLGVDHFAAFPPEWPRRIILGWSPAAICNACDEGVRPVVVTSLGVKERQPPAYGDGSARHGKGASTLGSRGPSAQITGGACGCGQWASPGGGPSFTPGDTRPAVVLDPFSGTGTTAMVARALGRTGIGVDLSADYCRLGQWRTNDAAQRAKVRGEDFRKPEPQIDGQEDLFGAAV
jgi:DNA modification methylase